MDNEVLTGRLRSPQTGLQQELLGGYERRNSEYALEYIVISDIAYVLSATEVGVIPPDAARSIVGVLLELWDNRADVFGKAGLEDALSIRSGFVSSRVDPPDAWYVHTGRNRGESVRQIVPRLYFRDVLARQREALRDLVDALVDAADRVKGAVAPVYHHLQHAGVSTLDEYLLSWAIAFESHMERSMEVDRRLDYAPPPVSLDPASVELYEATSRRLGFQRQATLWQELHMDDTQFSEPLALVALTSVTLSRLASDLKLWGSDEFGFFELDDGHASTSSMLPQKKNAFGLQVVVGQAAIAAGRLAAQLTLSAGITGELPSAFHAASGYQIAEEMLLSTRYLTEVIEMGRFDTAELQHKAFLGHAGASPLCDRLVYEFKVPFGLAHRAVATIVRAELEGEEVPDVAGAIAKRLATPLGISTTEMVEDLHRSVFLDADALPPRLRRVRERLGRRREVVNPTQETVLRLLHEGRAFATS